ncbi:MAG: response regulator [Phycisphaerales bacterium]|nr:response regulator [Phycisphaerales bacterium]
MHQARLHNRSILIVDDDEDILRSMEIAIKSEGASTETAMDGNTAISMCNHSNPDAVVLDMMLPKRSGFLVLEQIRELPEAPIVIMVTANEGRRHKAYAESLGVHDYLNKPVALDSLIETLARLLAERDALEGS